MWTPMNIILLNLVCSDFSVSIIGNPFALVSAWHYQWIFGESLCIAYGFFMSLLGITSITTLTVLAYERYCLVSCPFSATHLSTKGAKLSVCFIWIYSFLLTSPPLFGWGSYVPEAAAISCSVNWETKTLNATTYIIFLFIFGLIVPVCVITYSYSRIIKTMKENALRAGRVNKIESKVTRMIAVMIIAFLVAWTPYSIFALTEQFADPDIISNALAVLPALIAKSSICYNPIIYVISNSQFRASWRRIFGKENHHTTTMNETLTNQMSESSCRGYMECSFTSFDKKKKSRHKGNRKRAKIIQLNEKKDKDLNILIGSQKLRHNNNEIMKNHNNNLKSTQIELLKSDFQIIINEHHEMSDSNDFKDKFEKLQEVAEQCLMLLNVVKSSETLQIVVKTSKTLQNVVKSRKTLHRKI
ncbi:vertebrate ancient opsin-like [Chironomus tepperi]|uniref:vertebrate ancient opsin-like n=1 Tax=Chironomus tepperi TaxID=113505 RepID=UPI00391F2A7A